MFEVDFLPIEKTGGAGSKSGDAIAIRFTDPLSVERVVVIDGGFNETGDRLVDHIQNHYGRTNVDLVISTHPDADHINGLYALVDQMMVGELLIHRPRKHHWNAEDYSNIEAIDDILDLAKTKGVVVTEPFTGLSRFNDAIRVLGPSEAYYDRLLAEAVTDTTARHAKLSATSLRSSAFDLLDRTLPWLPIETLGEDGETSPRNSTSVITLLRVENSALLFTGDAGIEALTAAADEYEANVGSFSAAPLTFFQAPHHGSRRNLSSSLLDRMLGTRSAPFGSATSFISSAKADPKHPSPKVTNALQRRNLAVFATEGSALMHHTGSTRGWGPARPIPPLVEDGDE